MAAVRGPFKKEGANSQSEKRSVDTGGGLVILIRKEEKCGLHAGKKNVKKGRKRGGRRPNERKERGGSLASKR